MVYSRTINDQEYTFGVSGRLYKSNVLIYDHQTESLWSQLLEKAVAGEKAGTHLEKIHSQRMSYGSWLKRHPKTEVLSTHTGFNRNYSYDPYEGYYRVGSLMFPVGNVRKDMHPKNRVLGIEVNGKAKAYPLDRIGQPSAVINDNLGGREVVIEMDENGQVVGVNDQSGEPLVHIYSFWFAWQAFHPDTLVYHDKK